MKSVEDVVENQCCGCGACSQICPKKCIVMKENERGFLVPNVDKSACISCGLCKKVCPECKENVKLNKVIKAYAAITNNLKTQKNSTSGGAFYVLAKNIIDNNGVVFGAAWKSTDSVSHIAIKNEKDLIKLQQSKYVQSNIENTFLETKNLLMNNIKVLYSGTACQIGALKSFLQKDYENLITVEVACHGVPSPGLFRKYIQWRETKFKHKIIGFQFRNRDKHPGGEHFKSKVIFDNGKAKYFSIQNDPYYNAFLNGVTLRETCYSCKYKNEDRIADITLSDFWGIEKEFKEFPAYYGCSAIMINTPKADELWEKVKEDFIYTKCDKEKVYNHNKSMIVSSKRNKNKKFEKLNVDSEILFNQIRCEIKGKDKIKNLIKLLIPYKILYKLRRLWRR